MDVAGGAGPLSLGVGPTGGGKRQLLNRPCVPQSEVNSFNTAIELPGTVRDSDLSRQCTASQ
jgi:hypothetical protein